MQTTKTLIEENEIQLTDVHFKYANSEKGALHGISVSVKKGECVLLCGESGCGKTTITRLLNGLIPHFYEGELTGEVTVSGLNIKNEELYTIAAKTGSVFQNPRSQFFCLDTTSEIAFGCENMGLPETEILHRIENVKEEMQLKPLMNRNIFKLSGGEKQRIACASVAAMKPEIFILDEPTSNLDLDAIEDLKKTLKHWKKEGKTIVIAEHRLYWLKEICDRVIYMKDGVVGFDISMNEFAGFPEKKLQKLGLRSLIEQKLPVKSEKFSSEGEQKFSKPEKHPYADRVIGFKNYRFAYEKKEILNLSELEVPEGSIVAVTGHNGAGKSTFMKCLCGLEKKFKGRTFYRGKERNRKEMLKNCYMVMQDVNHQLFCETVEDEVQLGMDETKEAQIPGLLESMNLSDYIERHPMSLSGGQKQRVAIASALLADKSILIFDEPTSGLDYRHMCQTAQMIKSLPEKETTVFIITHDPELIRLCCTHMLHIEHGSVQEFYEFPIAKGDF